MRGKVEENTGACALRLWGRECWPWPARAEAGGRGRIAGSSPISACVWISMSGFVFGTAELAVLRLPPPPPPS